MHRTSRPPKIQTSSNNEEKQNTQNKINPIGSVTVDKNGHSIELFLCISTFFIIEYRSALFYEKE